MDNARHFAEQLLKVVTALCMTVTDSVHLAPCIFSENLPTAS